MPLTYCAHCRENSVKTRITKSKDYLWSGIKKRVEYCINKGCGYRLNLGDIQDKIIVPVAIPPNCLGAPIGEPDGSVI